MKIFTIFIIVLFCSITNAFLNNPLKVLNKCITDKECKPTEYCDHSGINPIGSCHAGKENNQACVFDRHCRSKICHTFKCTAKRPVKDGPCTKDKHEECIETQYCSHDKKDLYKCKNRRCSSACLKDAHCLSNKCSFFKCQKPTNACPAGF